MTQSQKSKSKVLLTLRQDKHKPLNSEQSKQNASTSSYLRHSCLRGMMISLLAFRKFVEAMSRQGLIGILSYEEL